MDVPRKPMDPIGIPLIFTPDEVAECFDQKGGGFLKSRFHPKRLRELQAAKVLQLILRTEHNTNARSLEELREYATVEHFSLVKARRTHWGYYLMKVEYVYEGMRWEQVFRFERNSGGGLSGTLYFNSRRRMVAK